MKIKFFLMSVVMTFTCSCTNEDQLKDATGVFEAIEVIVSSEANGRILSLNLTEGELVKESQVVGLVDSTQLHFNRLQLESSKVTVETNRPDTQAQIEATEREIAKQEKEKERIERLLAGDVATQKQLDDIESAILILKARLRSQKSSLSNSVDAVDAQSNTIDIQIAQLEDQIEKCKISSPIDGTVLVKYVEKGEVTGVGRALFKVADMENMILRAYVTSDQLLDLKVGQNLKVFAEFGKEDNREYEGKVSWISEKSEFTPKTIQTQDERANLVYAVKIAVKNDGYLKIGMYGGVKLAE